MHTVLAHELSDAADGLAELGGDVDLAPASTTNAIGQVGVDVREAELAHAGLARAGSLGAPLGEDGAPEREPLVLWAARECRAVPFRR